MISTATVDNAFTDEDDDSFEKIDGIEQLELSDGVEEEPDNMITLLEQDLFKARQDNERLQKLLQGTANSAAHLSWIAVVFVVLLSASALILALSPPPPTLAPVPSCPVPEAPAKCQEAIKCECADRELIVRPEEHGQYGFTVKEGFVKGVPRDTWAMWSGLEDGDEVVQVNGVDVRDIDADEIYKMMFDMPSRSIKVVVRRNSLALKRLEAASNRSFKRGVAFATVLTTTVYIAFIIYFPTTATNATAKVDNAIVKAPKAVESTEEKDEEGVDDDSSDDEEDDQFDTDEECSTQEESDDEEEEPAVEAKNEMESAPVDDRGFLEKTLDAIPEKIYDDLE